MLVLMDLVCLRLLNLVGNTKLIYATILTIIAVVLGMLVVYFDLDMPIIIGIGSGLVVASTLTFLQFAVEFQVARQEYKILCSEVDCFVFGADTRLEEYTHRVDKPNTMFGNYYQSVVRMFQASVTMSCMSPTIKKRLLHALILDLDTDMMMWELGKWNPSTYFPRTRQEIRLIDAGQ